MGMELKRQSMSEMLMQRALFSPYRTERHASVKHLESNALNRDLGAARALAYIKEEGDNETSCMAEKALKKLVRKKDL